MEQKSKNSMGKNCDNKNHVLVCEIGEKTPRSINEGCMGIQTSMFVDSKITTPNFIRATQLQIKGRFCCPFCLGTPGRPHIYKNIRALFFHAHRNHSAENIPRMITSVLKSHKPAGSSPSCAGIYPSQKREVVV